MGFIKKLNPFWSFIAVILGWRLIKDFLKYDTLKRGDFIFDAVFLIVFIISIYMIIKDFRKKN